MCVIHALKQIIQPLAPNLSKGILIGIVYSCSWRV